MAATPPFDEVDVALPAAVEAPESTDEALELAPPTAVLTAETIEDLALEALARTDETVPDAADASEEAPDAREEADPPTPPP
jgi:hypothetical protein